MPAPDFRPGDVVVRTFANGSEHRWMIVAGDDGSVRTAAGKVRKRSVDADGNFTSGIQTAWWTPDSLPRVGPGWRLERRPHWQMTYADRSRGDTGRYVVVNGSTRLPFESKADAIAEAQRRNGYQPVDGSEATYGAQLAREGRR